jgi:hypothetical protein
MMRILTFFLMLGLAIPAFGDNEKMVLYTPTGVWECSVGPTGPTAWTKVYDTGGTMPTLKGFTGAPMPPGPGDGGGDKPPVPDPEDPIVKKVATISAEYLQDDSDATIAYSIVDTVAKSYPTGGREFREALKLAAGLADGRLDMDGRLEAWYDAVIELTDSPALLKAGLTLDFDIDLPTLKQVYKAAETGEELEGESLFGLDIAGLLAVIKLVIELLDRLSDLWG